MPTVAKRNGVHYTPERLAHFLANQLCSELKGRRGTISILDPACGDGGLLVAVVNQLPRRVVDRLRLVGYEMDSAAARRARARLAASGAQVEIHVADFLATTIEPEFDAVISNPPYVRTQVIGAKLAQQLGERFGLKGRVDLYQAFTIAMSAALVGGGRLALLTSNRFMTTRSGASLREFMLSQFDLKSIWDLGDTRLFSAAVLPVIVIGERRCGGAEVESRRCDRMTEFTRVYVSESQNVPAQSAEGVLDVVQDRSFEGQVATPAGRFVIDRGVLQTVGLEKTWTLINESSFEWLEKIKSHRFCDFGDVAEIRVGIKTTADSVFIRDDWQEVPSAIRPEKKLLQPLVTHHDAKRWSIGAPCKTVLYPHQIQGGRRVAVDLAKHKKAERYFEAYRERLESRTYVTNSGRKWYEIWVPQNPADWAAPKIVWPDISERARFFYDASGAVVNGDCYWIKLKPEVDADWLLLMLAVGNSRVALKFYDTLFHNKLYAGRRRFMTQYVRQFPLPDLKSPIAKQIVSLVKKRLLPTQKEACKIERSIEDRVAQAFGLD